MHLSKMTDMMDVTGCTRRSNIPTPLCTLSEICIM